MAKIKGLIQEVRGNLDHPEIRVWCCPHRIGQDGDDWDETFDSVSGAIKFISQHPESEDTVLIAFDGQKYSLRRFKEEHPQEFDKLSF